MRSILLSIAFVLVSGSLAGAHEPVRLVARHDAPHHATACERPPPPPEPRTKPHERSVLERFAAAAIRFVESYTRAGTERRYHDNGQLRIEMTWVDGELDGDWVVYREDGSLFRFEQYDRGVRHGLQEFVYDDGRVRRTRTRQGHADGWSRTFAADGRITGEWLESNGWLIEGRVYRHEDGSLSGYSRGSCEGDETADYEIQADGRWVPRGKAECEAQGFSHREFDVDWHHFALCFPPPLDEHLARAAAGDMPPPCGVDLATGELACGLEGWPRKIFPVDAATLPPPPRPASMRE